MNNYLYNRVELNRPLTEEEINNQLRQDFSGMGKADSQALDDGVVITMNSTYLELVDIYYQERGLNDLFAFVIFSMCISGAFMCIYFGIVELIRSGGEGTGFLSLMVTAIVSFSFGLFSYKRFLMPSWFAWTHYPVRLNRKTQMVHAFKPDGSMISVPWQQIFFTRVRFGRSIPEYNINGLILADDKKTVIDTFTLGFANSRRDLVRNWAFIYSYMTVDNCLEDLRDIIAFCPPIADKKESYVFGYQSLIRAESRLEWLFLLVKIPMGLFASVTRYIAMQTSKIPRWSAEVEADCQVDPNDPIHVSAANNPKHFGRYMLANQSLEDYNALYQRQEQAMNRLREKVQAHIQQKERESL